MKPTSVAIQKRRSQPKDAKKVEAFFRHSWIVIREVDAIHLATALQHDVDYDQFDTFDTDLMKLSGTLGNPPLTIARPNLPMKLPFELPSDEEE